MLLADMKFDTDNNACTSLRIIAEKVRRGEFEITGFSMADAVGTGKLLKIEIKNPKEGA